MEPENKKNRNMILLIISVLLIVITGSILIALYHNDLKNNELQQEDAASAEDVSRNEYTGVLRSGFADVNNAKYDDAIKQYEELFARNILTPDDLRSMKIQYAQLLGVTGEDGVFRAFEILKSVIEAPEATERQKAAVLHAALNLYEIDGDSKKIELLLQSPFFADKSIPEGAINIKVRRLAELSNEYSITGIGFLRQGFWYANELLDNKNLLKDEALEYEKILYHLVTESRAYPYLERQNPSFESKSYLDSHFRGFNLGALALSNPVYIDEMKNEFESILKNVPRYHINNDLYTISLVPYTDFYYAAYLYELDSSKNIDKINELLDQLVSTIAFYKEQNHDTPRFIIFAQQVLNSTEREHHNFRFFKELAKIHEGFNQLLIENQVLF